jgi:RHS repeat-associated protein
VAGPPRAFKDLAYRYDSVGRMREIRRKGETLRRFDYDAQGRIASVAEADGHDTQLVFDDNDKLVKVRSGGRTAHIIDGIAECDDSGCRNIVSVGGRMVAVAGGRGKSLFFYNSDLTGSIRLVTNATGAVAARYAYGVYGNPVGSRRPDPAGLILSRGFLGQPQLPGSGYALLGSRLLDGSTGRFLQPELQNPMEEVLRRANPYSYGYNNPLSYADPDGQFPIIAAVMIVGAVIGGYEASRHGQNIFEGAFRGAAFAGLAYGFGVAGSAIVGDTVMGAALGEATFASIRASSEGGDAGRAFLIGGFGSLVGSGIGSATVEIIPVPATETALGAMSRQAARDYIRGASRAVIVSAVLGESDPFKNAGDRGLETAGYGLAMTGVYGGIAYAKSSGRVKWINHSYWVEVENGGLGKGIHAMRLGIFTMAETKSYDLVMDMPVIGPPRHYPSALVAHEDVHGVQAARLGHNFGIGYLAGTIFLVTDHTQLATGAYEDIRFEKDAGKVPDRP